MKHFLEDFLSSCLNAGLSRSDYLFSLWSRL